MTAKSHPAAIHFIPDQLPHDYMSRSDISTREPSKYVLFVFFLSNDALGY